MLAANALAALTRDLAAALGGMGLKSGDFGMPSLVEKPTREAESIFQGYAKAKPSKEDAYAAARAFLRGTVLDSWQRDLVASAISEPIREQAGAMMPGQPPEVSTLGFILVRVQQRWEPFVETRTVP